MKEIPLTRNQVALVDDADYPDLILHKWYALWSGNHFYAVRAITVRKGQRALVMMHREILGLDHNDKRQGHHANHNTLNNSRLNLRIVSNQENQHSRIFIKGYHRVRRKSGDKYQASIEVNNRTMHIGYFDTPEMAHNAYLVAKQQYHHVVE